jgi:hypothetical protein
MNVFYSAIGFTSTSDGTDGVGTSTLMFVPVFGTPAPRWYQMKPPTMTARSTISATTQPRALESSSRAGVLVTIVSAIRMY